MCVKTSRITKRIQLLTFPIGDKHLLLIGEHEVTLETHSGLDLVTERNRHFLSTVPHSPHQPLQYAPIIVEENVSVLNRLVKHGVLLAHDDPIPHNHVMLLLYVKHFPVFPHDLHRSSPQYRRTDCGYCSPNRLSGLSLISNRGCIP